MSKIELLKEIIVQPIPDETVFPKSCCVALCNMPICLASRSNPD